MITREKIEEIVNNHIRGSDLFIVDIRVSPTNKIKVLIDSEKGVTVNECVNLSRAIEGSLNRDEQDFQLEVSSPGLSEPLMVLQQYLKNIGRDVEVNTMEGQKFKGKLIRLTDNGLVIEEKVKIKGEKNPQANKTVEKEFDFDRILSTKVIVSYK